MKVNGLYNCNQFTFHCLNSNANSCLKCISLTIIDATIFLHRLLKIMVALLQFGWPFAGQEDYNRLRPLSYRGADSYSVTGYSEQFLFFAKVTVTCYFILCLLHARI